MTPQERAKKIVEEVGEHFEYCSSKGCNCAPFIVAQITEAQREVGECFKCRRAHASYCMECFTGELESAEREAVMKSREADNSIVLSSKTLVDKAYAEGFEAAKEQAAKIAGNHEKFAIARLIRAMKIDGEKK